MDVIDSMNGNAMSWHAIPWHVRIDSPRKGLLAATVAPFALRSRLSKSKSRFRGIQYKCIRVCATHGKGGVCENFVSGIPQEGAAGLSNGIEDGNHYTYFECYVHGRKSWQDYRRNIQIV